MKKYYKVVKEGLKSLVVDGKAKVQYKIGEWVSAPEWAQKEGYHLLVFDSLEIAKLWKGNIQVFIFEVEIKNKIKKMPLSCSYCHVCCGELIPSGVVIWPPGTVMAKKVKLVRRVE
jgi:hypothetical protein